MDKSTYKIYSQSGEAWDAMYDEIAKAKKSVYWELFIFVDDKEGNRFFDLLQNKSRNGVDVKIIVDSLGSFGLSRKTVNKLKKTGVDIRFFHERKNRYRGIWKKMISRTHRKILVVDEEVGFIGGVNIQASMKEWLDIHVRIEGNPVHSLLRAFAKMYIICGGPKKNVKHLLKYKFRVKQDFVDFIYDDAGTKKSLARKKYTEALLKARERVILFSPYYFPDKKFMHALWKARKRGVRVDLLIPYRTDVRIATYAGYAWLSLMKKLGVKVHMTDKMMHGKGVVMDDEWAMVGSSNIDHGSFFDNYEANIHSSDHNFVSDLKNTIQGWMSLSKKLDDILWEKRGRLQKFKEWIAVKLYTIWYPDFDSSNIKNSNNKKKK